MSTSLRGRRVSASSFIGSTLILLAGCGAIGPLQGNGPTSFTVCIEGVQGAVNVTEAAISAGVWLVHTQSTPIFSLDGQNTDFGLLDIAINGDPTPPTPGRPIAEVLEDFEDVLLSGVFEELSEFDCSGGTANESYRITFDAPTDADAAFSFVARLQIAEFDEMNWFLAPDPEGISLFGDGGIAGQTDITGFIKVWETRPNDSGEGFDVGEVDPQSAPMIADVLHVTLTANPGATVVDQVGGAVLDELLAGFVCDAFLLPIEICRAGLSGGF